ncbi:FAD-dependent oxidoreductase [Muricoccus radiodurans]|uniref:oxidoreductase n=1 Tax=Muricoccus radiodurans TaxID=2231721 RepID=UPI003CF950BE
MPSDTPFPRLFSPLRLGPREAANRIMRLPTNSAMAERSRPTDAMTAYYASLARGGAGSIVTEGFAVHAASTRGDRLVALFDREAIPALSRFATGVQQHGALLIAQLIHGGRQHHTVRTAPLLWGPSAIACPYSGGVPHPMSSDEIEEVIASFALSAANAREAGFAGVEIHGAQGYLLQQFASPLSNRRDDVYGGSFENRLRFALRVIEAVRSSAGPDMVVGYRLGLDEFVPGGLTAEDGRRIAAVVSSTGAVDYLSLSQGTFASIEMHLPDRHLPPAAFTALHAGVRPHAHSLPLITSGRIGHPDTAEALLESGAADMIGLSRALTADAEWPAKARRGHLSAIRPCIACNECWSAITNGDRLRCVVNPTLGAPPAPAAGAGPRVIVVGGGPAGLEAACTLAEAGARVALWESAAKLGGKLRETAGLPHQAELGAFADHLVARAADAGVAIRTGHHATADLIRAERPDAVLLATGAGGNAFSLASDGSLPLISDIPGTLPPPDPTRPVILHDADGANWTSAVAEGIAAAGHRVLLVTRFFEPLRALSTVSRIFALRELDRLGATWLTNREPLRIDGGAVILLDRLSGREERIGAAALVLTGAQQPLGAMAEELRAHGIRTITIGDAVAPRRLSDALSDAIAAARRLMVGAATTDQTRPGAGAPGNGKELAA